MRNIILKILVCILKIIYLPMRLLKVKNKITYISRQSNTENIDFKLIRMQMEKDYPEYKNIVITEVLKADLGIFKQLNYCFCVLKQMYHLATSKVVIVDSYCITTSVLSHKKKTKVIQIWHALSAIKKFGYQTVGTQNGSNEKTAKIMCMHKNYDYVLAPSKVTAEIYEKAFNIDKEKILYIGMPRIDYIMKKNPECESEIIKKYNIDKSKQTILYAPPFRKNERVNVDELISRIDTKKYNLIIKLHPLDMENSGLENKEGIILIKGEQIEDLIKISDKFITDYSSLAMEAALLEKEIYFYIYDINEYEKNTGLNFDFKNEEIGKYAKSNVKELSKILDEKYDKNVLKRFKEKYISVNTENCTEKLTRFIINN